jgi:HSP20 family protein
VSPANPKQTVRSPLLVGPFDIFRDPSVLLRRIQERTNQPHLYVDVERDTWIPAMEVAQRENQLEVLVELPGIEWMDIRVEVFGDVLVIQGERHRDIPGVIPRSVRGTERRYGHFYREIELPSDADVDNIRAELHNGMLRVTIPVFGGQNNGRRVPVLSGS